MGGLWSASYEFFGVIMNVQQIQIYVVDVKLNVILCTKINNSANVKATELWTTT